MSNPFTPPDPGQASNPYAPRDPDPAQSPYGTPAPSQPSPSLQPPYDQPSYGQSPYGQPPYGQSPYPPTPYPQSPNPYAGAPVGTDGVSIAALVTGIIGTGPVALVLGIVGLNRVKKSGRSGQGLAIAGIVLGGLGTLALIGFLALVALVWNSDEARDAIRDGITESQRHAEDDAGALDDLLGVPPTWATGTCLQIPTDLSTEEAPLDVDCAEEHNGEVYAAQSVDAPEYPGEDAVVAQAEEFCDTQFPASLIDGSALTMPTYVYYYPTDESWSLGDTEVSCIAVEDDLSSWTGAVVTP